MSQEAETPKAPSNGASNKVVIILAGGALLLSLVNTALLVMNHLSHKVEDASTEVLSAVSTSAASIEKKVDALQTAGTEWQTVLKNMGDKPDAQYKIVKSADGLLSLVEVPPPMPADAAAPAPESKH